MLKKYFYLSLMTLSALTIAKANKKTSDLCTKYKAGTYISYIKDIFLITQDCKRRLLNDTESQDITRKGYEVKQVAVDVILGIPKEPLKKTFTFEEVRSKYKNHCVSAGKVTYLVMQAGKKAYFSRDIAKKSCPNGIDPITLKELRVLPDLEPFAAPKNLYPPVKEGNVPKKISTKTACAKLKDNSFATFHSKIYQIKTRNNTCYLLELSSQSHEVRMQIGKITPTELTPSQFVSLKKEKENPKKLSKKG